MGYLLNSYFDLIKEFINEFMIISINEEFMDKIIG
jgi:hypothetical protein